jgi:hypothetical protein
MEQKLWLENKQAKTKRQLNLCYRLFARMPKKEYHLWKK